MSFWPFNHTLSAIGPLSNFPRMFGTGEISCERERSALDVEDVLDQMCKCWPSNAVTILEILECLNSFKVMVVEPSPSLGICQSLQ